MKTHQQFLQDFKEKGNKNLVICGEYLGCETPIDVQCNNCGSIFKTTPHSLLKKIGCPYCSGRAVDPNKNSFAVTYPELLPFLVSPDKAYEVTKGSKQECEVECPVCKRRYSKPYYRIGKEGIKCSFCNKMSYPNKFLRILLQEIPGITNLYFEHTFTIEGKQKIRYDATFQYKNNSFVIEINGGQHYKSCSYNNFDVNIQKRKDELKRQYAVENNMIYIEIDARKSFFSYIKEQTLISDLSKYINLDTFDWNNLYQKISNYSLLYKICSDYEENLLRVNELEKKYQIDHHHIARYLRDGKELGLCPSYQSNTNRQGVRVEAYDSEYNFIGSYPSIAICAEKLNQQFNLNFLKNSISHVLRGTQKTHRNFYFKRGDFYE